MFVCFFNTRLNFPAEKIISMLLMAVNYSPCKKGVLHYSILTETDIERQNKLFRAENNGWRHAKRSLMS